MTYVIKTYNLTKIYNGIEVVSNVNMSVKKGEIYGFLGPNGAGKTTLLKLITNLIKPTNGEIEIFNEKLLKNSYEVFKRIGAIIEYPVFYTNLTGKENLKIHCDYMGFYDKKAIDEVLKIVNLRGIENKPVKNYSLGMKQRLGIARAIITKPELLLLDEPINGLDPEGIKDVRDLLTMLSKQYGMSILVSSHILTEVEQIADTIGIISKGRLIQEIQMNDIKRETTEYVDLQVDNVRKASMILDDKLKLSNFKIIDQNKIRIYDQNISLKEISKALILNNILIQTMIKGTSSLEDYFLSITNGGEVK
ncbi:ABC transporter ATP-binding protein [Clostridiaceae bacterium M8S5]|nr:ABC transporter ATP-binding protein [Clostridiaceae bacterium M8S5]